jgi:hypothetical protein
MRRALQRRPRNRRNSWCDAAVPIKRAYTVPRRELTASPRSESPESCWNFPEHAETEGAHLACRDRASDADSF